MWELSSGELLLSVLFDVEIMSVTFDPSEYFLFCGGRDGNIFQVSLCSQVSDPEGGKGAESGGLEETTATPLVSHQEVTFTCRRD